MKTREDLLIKVHFRRYRRFYYREERLAGTFK